MNKMNSLFDLQIHKKDEAKICNDWNAFVKSCIQKYMCKYQINIKLNIHNIERQLKLGYEWKYQNQKQTQINKKYLDFSVT